MTDRTCTVSGCDRPHRSKGYCGPHYARWRKNGDVQAEQPVRDRVDPTGTCSISGCQRPIRCRMLCAQHYADWLRESPDRPKCSVESCDRRVKGIGYCESHLRIFRRNGTPTPHKPTFEERFWAKVNKRGPIPEVDPSLGACWLWTASTTVDGYGQVSVPGRATPQGAHRVAYELLIGPLRARPWSLDHLCMTPLCVNPAHLEEVTLAENARRANAARRQSGGRLGSRDALGA